ncbi:hypothetical protein EJB05_34265 [Eragrostis curvula]|uniref:Uncharacterized protein n=1 Tax=Eragrostis curvula TaxID=38414 RepID=A0A5J9U3J1_9POAL|nr:hypothetical protein EJB05_34265 [Eragrostis curvula]
MNSPVTDLTSRSHASLVSPASSQGSSAIWTSREAQTEGQQQIERMYGPHCHLPISGSEAKPIAEKPHYKEDRCQVLYRPAMALRSYSSYRCGILEANKSTQVLIKSVHGHPLLPA